MSIATARPEVPAAAEVMAGLADAADAGAVLAGWLPTHAGYRALRDKLAELRADAALADAPTQIPTGPSVRVGMRDPRLPLLRARLGLGPTEDAVYDRTLAARVAGFQREAGLPASGVLNAATIAALNQPARAALESDIVATMERWRWLPADAGRDHLMVNVPEFMVRKVEDGRVVHAARVVVGKTERATPIFSDMMDHLVINPSWTVPPTILREDFLPRMAQDPEYASRRGMEVIRRGERITLRQPPGPTNALGQIKFMFPNDHAVYLHDTPQRNLFNASSRAFSSGCVRVENPLRLAELVLGGESAGWSQQRLRSLLGPAERTIRLPTPLPVHLTYMTVTVDDTGSVRRFEDIYGLHRRTREALGL
jgi:murein L,D-transpeptidase YcbB/YkuD